VLTEPSTFLFFFQIIFLPSRRSHAVRRQCTRLISAISPRARVRFGSFCGSERGGTLETFLRQRLELFGNAEGCGDRGEATTRARAILESRYPIIPVISPF